MSFKIYSERILRSKVKLALIIVLILIPIVDIGQIVQEVVITGAPAPDPRYAAFNALYTVGTNHILHKLMFWFLPIYLLIITGEDALEDYELGYSNILRSRMSRKGYIWGRARNSGVFSFLIIFVSLSVNYILLQLIFDKGGDIRLSGDLLPEDYMYTLGFYHPVILTTVNILMSAILAGLISMIGTAIAMTVHDRKIVYGITFILWLIFVLMSGGLMSVLHPFPDTPIEDYISSFAFLVIGYLAIALITLFIEEKSDEI